MRAIVVWLLRVILPIIGINGATCFLLRAAIEENAFNRMKKVVKWYISGFYKKPKVGRVGGAVFDTEMVTFAFVLVRKNVCIIPNLPLTRRD